MQEKKPKNYYALKMLALILFGVGGIFLLIYLIELAFAQKSILSSIAIGIAVILLVPLVNTVTGFFDDSVETSPRGVLKNYGKVLLSLVMQLLFLLFMFPFIGIYLGAVLGAMGIVVCIVFFGIYLVQNMIGWDIGAAHDIGVQVSTVGLVFLGLVIYEGLFCLGYYFYNKYEEKIWDFLRKVFNK